MARLPPAPRFARYSKRIVGLVRPSVNETWALSIPRVFISGLQAGWLGVGGLVLTKAFRADLSEILGRKVAWLIIWQIFGFRALSSAGFTMEIRKTKNMRTGTFIEERTGEKPKPFGILINFHFRWGLVSIPSTMWWTAVPAVPTVLPRESESPVHDSLGAFWLKRFAFTLFWFPLARDWFRNKQGPTFIIWIIFNYRCYFPKSAVHAFIPL